MDTLSSWSRFRITSYDTHFALTDEYSIGELRTCMHLSLKLSKSKDVRLKCRPGYKTQTVHHENYFRLFNSEKSSMYWYSRSFRSPAGHGMVQACKHQFTVKH